MLFTFAPVAPISIALLPFGQLPLVEAKSALLLLSMQALTTGTLFVFANAKLPIASNPTIKLVDIAVAFSLIIPHTPSIYE
jgi:uncharacterized protein involved in response to NO